ncbi:MAG: hypothetical protein KAI67_00575 [Candidatus Pacebacteria bacterium]|nr:hypothetical protein [Candidatus Paceibacterota bacterium]
MSENSDGQGYVACMLAMSIATMLPRGSAIFAEAIHHDQRPVIGKHMAESIISGRVDLSDIRISAQHFDGQQRRDQFSGGGIPVDMETIHQMLGADIYQGGGIPAVALVQEPIEVQKILGAMKIGDQDGEPSAGYDPAMITAMATEDQSTGTTIQQAFENQTFSVDIQAMTATMRHEDSQGCTRDLIRQQTAAEEGRGLTYQPTTGRSIMDPTAGFGS